MGGTSPKQAIQFLRSIGYTGTFRPADIGVVFPRIRFLLEFTPNTQINLTGPKSVVATSNDWTTDPNLFRFLVKTGRFFVVFDQYQFRVAPITALSPADTEAAAAAFETVLMKHIPQGGVKQYDYYATPGIAFSPGVVAVATAEADANVVGAQYAQVGPTDIGTPIAVDFANDQLVISVPSDMPAGVMGALDLWGFAMDYDGNDEKIGAMIRASGQDGSNSTALKARAARRGGRIARDAEAISRLPQAQRRMLLGEDD